MKDAYGIADIGRNPAGVVRQAQLKGAVTVSRNGKTVAFLVSKDRMEAIIETLEIMATPEAMKAIRDHQAGKTKFKDVACLDED